MKKTKKREIIYDFIRVLSCVFVIGIHSTNHLMLESISRIGLPMFTFLSGILLLNGKEEKTSEFYIKRLTKIIIPLYLYSLIYLFIYKYDYNLNLFDPINFINELIKITNGPIHYHLWYVYMIIGIYLCTPYLKKMCKSLTDNDCRNLLILIFIISIVKYTLPSLNINIGISNITFIDWTLIFLLGYLTTKECINKHYIIIYFSGIISFCFNLCAKVYFPQLTNLNDLSITMMLQVMAVYLLLFRNKKKICKDKTLNKIIIHVSKYTWEMYLIHIIILDQLKYYILNLNIDFNIANIILIFCVAITSYLCTLIIHNLITNPLQKLIIKNTIEKRK